MLQHIGALNNPAYSAALALHKSLQLYYSVVKRCDMIASKGTIMSYRLTLHAETRMQQRGIKKENLVHFLDYADLSKPVGRHLQAIRISKDGIRDAIADGLNAHKLVRLLNMVVVNSDDGAVVTCAFLYGRKAKNYTRRDRRKYWRS